MTIRLIDPDDTRHHDTRTLLKFGLDAPDTVVVHLPPGTRHASEASSTVVRQLNMAEPGKGQSGSGNLGLITSALAANGVRQAIVAGAEALDSATISNLIASVASAVDDVWLLPTGPGNDPGRKRLRSWADETVDTATLRRHLLALTSTPPASAREERSDPQFPDVPAACFATFLARCDQRLPTRDVKVVEEHMDRLVAELRDAIEANTADALVTALHTLAAEHNEPTWATMLSKSLQIAALVTGRALGVDEPTFLHRCEAVGTVAHLPNQTWQTITRQLSLRAAAACVLASLGVPADQVVGIPRSDVATDGSVVLLPAGRRRSVPHGARSALIAQHLEIAIYGPEDLPFLTSNGREPGVKVVTDALRAAAKVSGVPFASRWNSRRHTTALREEWGIDTRSTK